MEEAIDMTATIVTIGDELLIGQIVNTNASWIGEQLTLRGVDVIRTVTVGDSPSMIKDELGRALENGRIAILTGGLGPTHDDVTKHAVAEFFGDRLTRRQDVLDAVEARFASRGIRVLDVNRDQALAPESFKAVVNRAGTAPALLRRTKTPKGEGLVALLPGVPHEMKHFMEEAVLPEIETLGEHGAIAHRTLLTAGLGESLVHERLAGIDELLGDDVSLAYLPNIHGVRVRATVRAATAEEAERRRDEVTVWIRERLGVLVYGEGSDTLEGALGRMLRERNYTIAVAESCTGGLVAHRITNVAGASDYMVGGIVSYGNSVKSSLLGVDATVLAEHGAVSEQVARCMAEGVRSALGSDTALSTTGIMGPGGGTPDKPVGTVWVGLALPDRTEARLLRLGTSRLRNKERAAAQTMNELRILLGEGA